MEANQGPVEIGKHTELNFKLCIKCQGSKKEKLKEPPGSQKESTYDKFLTAVRLRAQFGNTDFLLLGEKIGNLTPQDLTARNAMWHRTCYAECVNKEHIARDENRYNRACVTSDVALLSRRTVGRPSTSSNVSEMEDSFPKMPTRSKFTTNTENKRHSASFRQPRMEN